ncbi:sulfotransferase domain-containing protein [Roseovarius sp.]|uniref:sulfotransferase domain-containing protein n=1 Tax=Roseovarius sp. TaxID=1486281 RepID=UPI00356913ED
MTIPDFFLIGAPKCGTTSLALWLEEHPQVFMCALKEPFFFCTDIKAYRPVRTWQEYCRLFDSARGVLAVGEASTSYLRSRVAVPAILRVSPEARFTVCLRNPVDMIASVHAQMVRGVREDVRDLRTALALESTRRRGNHLPKRTIEPKDLIYSDTCALGSQLARLYDMVDPARVHLIFMDDLSINPRKVWADLQIFLGVSDDGRTEFTTENARAAPRSVTATRLIGSLHQVKNRVIPGRSLGIGAGLRKALERPPNVAETTMPAALRADLVQRFEGEIDILERLTGRDLSAWREEAA